MLSANVKNATSAPSTTKFQRALGGQLPPGFRLLPLPCRRCCVSTVVATPISCRLLLVACSSCAPTRVRVVYHNVSDSPTANGFEKDSDSNYADAGTLYVDLADVVNERFKVWCGPVAYSFLSVGTEWILNHPGKPGVSRWQQP